MDQHQPPPAPPPSTTPTPPPTHPPLPPTTTATKLRFMVSYGGHILPRPRPHSTTLFYAGGETRLVSLARHSLSLSSLSSHLSRSLFHNRPFLLKYLLPESDLDSLISVTTDEDFVNMLEEHDRISSSSGPARIRLFLFPVRPESLDSALADPKSDSWFADALKGTGVLQKVQSADVGLLIGLDSPDLEALVERGEARLGPESLVLETTSSFGSTSSSVSMSNVTPVSGGVVHYEESGLKPSIDSDKAGGGNMSFQPKAGEFQEPLIQVSAGPPLYSTALENTVPNIPSTITTQPAIHVVHPHFPQQSDGKQLQQGIQYIQVPQYPTTQMPPYYPVYQMPMHQQQHMCRPNQYPVYLVPVRPPPYHNMPMQYNFIDYSTGASTLAPLHPQTAVMAQPIAQSIAEAAAAPVSLPASQGQPVSGLLESHNASEPVVNPPMAAVMHSSEFNDEVVYNPIYKTQPSAPSVPSQYDAATTKGTNVLFPESAQPNNTTY